MSCASLNVMTVSRSGAVRDKGNPFLGSGWVEPMPQFFDEGQFVKGPWHPSGEDVTLTIWVDWQRGDGPLVKTEDGGWAFPYDHDGSLAFRVGGEGQVTVNPTADVLGCWAFYALAVEGLDATLWIDGNPIQTLNAASGKPQEANLVVMEDAIGHAAHFAVWERRLSDDELREQWEAGNADPNFLK
jgi:Concanavalin A-like lectin/glucanases superfamily